MSIDIMIKVPTYAALPPNANNGDKAIALDTLITYTYDAAAVNWVTAPVGGDIPADQVLVEGTYPEIPATPGNLEDVIEDIASLLGDEALWDRASSVLSPQNANDSISIAATTAAYPRIGKSSANESAQLRVGDTADGSHSTAEMVVTDITGARHVQAKLDAVGSANGIRAFINAKVQSNSSSVILSAAGNGTAASTLVLDGNATNPARLAATVTDNASNPAIVLDTTAAVTSSPLLSIRNNNVEKMKVGPQGEITSTRGILQARAALAALQIDFAVDQILTKSISSNSSLTAINPIQGKVILLECTSSSSADLTLPAGTVIISGAYDNSGAVNYIMLMCNNSSGPSYLATISQEV